MDLQALFWAAMIIAYIFENFPPDVANYTRAALSVAADWAIEHGAFRIFMFTTLSTPTYSRLIGRRLINSCRAGATGAADLSSLVKRIYIYLSFRGPSLASSIDIYMSNTPLWLLSPSICIIVSSFVAAARRVVTRVVSSSKVSTACSYIKRTTSQTVKCFFLTAITLLLVSVVLSTFYYSIDYVRDSNIVSMFNFNIIPTVSASDAPELPPFNAQYSAGGSNLFNDNGTPFPGNGRPSLLQQTLGIDRSNANRFDPASLLVSLMKIFVSAKKFTGKGIIARSDFVDFTDLLTSTLSSWASITAGVIPSTLSTYTIGSVLTINPNVFENVDNEAFAAATEFSRIIFRLFMHICTDTALRLIVQDKETENGYNAFQRLKRRYANVTVSTIGDLENKISSWKWPSIAIDPQDAMLELTELWNLSASYGLPVADTQRVTFLISKLRTSPHKHLVAVWGGSNIRQFLAETSSEDIFNRVYENWEFTQEEKKPNSDQVYTAGATCRICKSPTCPGETQCSKRRCLRCGGVGHDINSCRSNLTNDRNKNNNRNNDRGRNNNQNKPPKPCPKCKSTKHKLADCPEVECHECGQKGHIRPNCPKLADRVNATEETQPPSTGLQVSDSMFTVNESIDRNFNDDHDMTEKHDDGVLDKVETDMGTIHFSDEPVVSERRKQRRIEKQALKWTPAEREQLYARGFDIASTDTSTDSDYYEPKRWTITREEYSDLKFGGGSVDSLCDIIDDPENEGESMNTSMMKQYYTLKYPDTEEVESLNPSVEANNIASSSQLNTSTPQPADMSMADRVARIVDIDTPEGFAAIQPFIDAAAATPTSQPPTAPPLLDMTLETRANGRARLIVQGFQPPPTGHLGALSDGPTTIDDDFSVLYHDMVDNYYPEYPATPSVVPFTDTEDQSSAEPADGLFPWLFPQSDNDSVDAPVFNDPDAEHTSVVSEIVQSTLPTLPLMTQYISDTISTVTNTFILLKAFLVDSGSTRNICRNRDWFEAATFSTHNRYHLVLGGIVKQSDNAHLVTITTKGFGYVPLSTYLGLSNIIIDLRIPCYWSPDAADDVLSTDILKQGVDIVIRAPACSSSPHERVPLFFSTESDSLYNEALQIVIPLRPRITTTVTNQGTGLVLLDCNGLGGSTHGTSADDITNNVENENTDKSNNNGAPASPAYEPESPTYSDTSAPISANDSGTSIATTSEVTATSNTCSISKSVYSQLVESTQVNFDMDILNRFLPPYTDVVNKKSHKNFVASQSNDEWVNGHYFAFPEFNELAILCLIRTALKCYLLAPLTTSFTFVLPVAKKSSWWSYVNKYFTTIMEIPAGSQKFIKKNMKTSKYETVSLEQPVFVVHLSRNSSISIDNWLLAHCRFNHIGGSALNKMMQSGVNMGLVLKESASFILCHV